MMDSFSLRHLSLGIKMLNNLISLELNVSWNYIKINAILEFTSILAEMKNIENLNLNFNENNNRIITIPVVYYE